MNDIEKPDILAVFEYVGYQVPSPRREGWCKIPCPVHDDRTPSASISVELGRWKCFTCDLNEDGLDVIQREKGVSFLEARRLAAEIDGGSSLEVRTVHRDSGRPARRSLWTD